MPEQRIEISVNSNFHHIAGKNLFEPKGDRFHEYRRKAHTEDRSVSIQACDGCYLRDSEIEKLVSEEGNECAE